MTERVVDRAYGEKQYPPAAYNTQFHLSTILLCLIWFGTGMSIWSLRQPWIKSYESMPVDTPFIDSPNWYHVIVRSYHTGEDNVVIVHGEHAEQEVISEWPTPTTPSNLKSWGYIDKERILLIEIDGKTTHLYKRRFPEAWWGHFYRVEIYAFVLLSIYLSYRFIKWMRNIPDISQ